MSLTLERPAQRSQPRQIVAWVLGTALLLAMLVPAMRALQDLPRADVTFVNRTRWDIHVDLLLDDGRSRVSLGTLGTGKAVRIQEIGEPGGDEWTFEFAAWDETAELTVSDQRLRAGQYRVAVPDALRQRLEAADAPPSPDS